MTPTSEQSTIIAAMGSSPSNLIVNAYAGCIAAGTNIRTRRGNDPTVRNIPIERLLHQRKPEIPTFVQCDIDGRADYLQMLGCFYKGLQETIRVETTLGEVIATPDHEFKTQNGWKAAADLTTKDDIISRTAAFHGRKLGRVTIYSVQHHPFAYTHQIGEYGNYKRIHRARLVIEAAMNNLTLEEMILIVRHNPVKAATLKYLSNDVEVHHKNEDPSDDRIDNLKILSSTEHKQEHKMHLNHTRLGASQVISITKSGNRYVYDIAMPSPHHNFMANGHVVHNCGKTATLEMIERHAKEKPILFLAFNKKIADEATKRMSSTTTVRTFNGLGHRIWASQTGRNLTLNTRKSADILREIINEVPRREQGAMWDSYWAVINGVATAKSVGYVPEGKYPQARRLCSQAAFHAALDESPDDLTADLIDAVLHRSIQAAFQGKIDYNDQPYMPAVFGAAASFPRYPLVLVDEAQDLNPINHALLDQLAQQRVVFVGDRFQSIYGFRQSVQNGMATLQDRFAASPLNLSVSFRCPQAIVEAARWRVPGFQWIKEGGHVQSLDGLFAANIDNGSVFLCRNNAPLFGLALRLLSIGRSVSVAGSDIGPKLVSLMKKLGPESLTQAQTLSAIESWRAERLDRGSTSADDLADCMKVFAEHGSTLGTAIAYAEHVLAQTGTIRLMTIHKSKGLEFNTVYHLDPWLCREDEQDLNLRYVAITRSKDRYFEINSKSILW